MSELMRNAQPKPAKGTAIVSSRLRRRARKAAEDATMQAAKRRDGFVCRYPACEYRTMNLRIEACHMKHRGMGGNPSGDRTTRDTLIAFCVRHHGDYDTNVFDIDPQTPEGTDGPVDFWGTHPKTGKWEVFARETVIGVSVAVGL